MFNFNLARIQQYTLAKWKLHYRTDKYFKNDVKGSFTVVHKKMIEQVVITVNYKK